MMGGTLVWSTAPPPKTSAKPRQPSTSNQPNFATNPGYSSLSVSGSSAPLPSSPAPGAAQPSARPPPPQQSVLPENHVRHPCSLSPSSHRPLVAFPQQHGLGYIALGYGTCPAPNSPKKKLFTKYFAQLYARWIVSLSSLGVTKPHWEESV
jgi:hypothetical protein